MVLSHECLPWQFDCQFGSPKCISQYKVNDGAIDCTSGFDEGCPPHNFVCTDKSACIDFSKYQDGVAHCKDKSDEPCPAGHFLCNDHSKCVDGSHFQDGVADCSDGSDEDLERVKDGKKDCEDGSDEKTPSFVSSPKCADGSLARVARLHNQTSEQSIQTTITQCKDSSICRETLGEMCIIVGGAPHCVCKKGTIRAQGTPRCVPEPLLQQYLNNIIGNCTEIQRELIEVYGPQVSFHTESSYGSYSAHSVHRTIERKEEVCDPAKTKPCKECTITQFECWCGSVRCVDLERVKDGKKDCEDGSDEKTPSFVSSPKCADGSLARVARLHNQTSEQSIQTTITQCKDSSICRETLGEMCIIVGGAPHCVCKKGTIRAQGTPRCVPEPLLQQYLNNIIGNCTEIQRELIEVYGPQVSFHTESSYGSYSAHSVHRTIERKEEVCDPAKTKPCKGYGEICITDKSGRSRCGCANNGTRIDGVCLINECASAELNDCDENASCMDSVFSYECFCNEGYIDASSSPTTRPGIKCVKLVNECASGDLNNCDPNAECIDKPIGYTCHCKNGFVDASDGGARQPGRKCLVNECSVGLADCDPHAECVDLTNGYTCQCPHGFTDVSNDPLNKPGRICAQLKNQCASPNFSGCPKTSKCVGTEDGFVCRCTDGYIDVNPSTPGLNCSKAGSDPCQDYSLHDCDSVAECFSEQPGYFQCRCPKGFVDISSDRRFPGRKCKKRSDPCQDYSLHDCDSVAECFSEQPGYFQCRCPKGFVDISSDRRFPGRKCKKIVDECALGTHECDGNADCVDTLERYTCKCKPGWSDISADPLNAPGRNCRKVVDECALGTHECDGNADCVDTLERYTCKCKPGWSDISADPLNAPGRNCRKANLCANIDCAAEAECRETPSGPVCECSSGYVDISRQHGMTAGRVCRRVINECAEGKHDCSSSASCIDTAESFTCRCRDGYRDESPDLVARPGRVCVRAFVPEPPECDVNDPMSCDAHKKEVCLFLNGTYKCECAAGYSRLPDGRCLVINECEDRRLNDCAENADCIDQADGYTCRCRNGYADVSPPGVKGRICRERVNECSNPSKYHVDCDANAICVDTEEDYTCSCKCQCYAGFVDVSSSANLQPGRVCTVQTTCPKQKTDLMFLVDGSGSIGSYVFKNEVLRFVKEFVELFDIGLDNTRVGLIQYSDQIRHEFDLSQYTDKASVIQAISQVHYLTGLTRTGAAIQHMVMEGFSERRGARAESDEVARVAIVITDGRSQDNVTEPAIAARKLHVNMFAIGVTDHVLASELESIAGSPAHWFYVDRFKDLDTRLRSLIQKAACPSPEPKPRPLSGCSATAQTGCDRSLNEICLEVNGVSRCQCPDKFERHPETRVCGGELCNPQIATSCPHPEVCTLTPFSNYRCICPKDYFRDQRSGICLSKNEQNEPKVLPSYDSDCNNGGVHCSQNEHCVRDKFGKYRCECLAGYERSARNGDCTVPGSCDPTLPNPCDVRKREKCLLHPSGQYHSCQCAQSEKRQAVTGICLRDECLLGTHDCDRSARCIDTDDGYLCSCKAGFIDQSPDPVNKPGRLCVAEQNECADGTHRCSPNAICTDTTDGYICRCKPGYIDFSPNPHSFGGLVCKEVVNECENPSLNTCHKDALCIDTADSYKCICKSGYADLDELRNPGRRCEKEEHNDRCSAGNNDCDRNARCIPRGTNDYVCACHAGFRDKSPNPAQPGRVCIPLIPECDNPTLNDCDSPDRAICTDTDEGYLCRCRQGFLDISPNIATKPGRLCKPLENECAKGTDDCARDGGICEDTPDSFTCRCAINYLDVSFDRQNRPGRKCKRLVDECQTGQNDCSPEATCTDTEDSYVCACPNKYIDVSPDTVHKPGRRCLLRVNECRENRHDCSPNADCIDTAESFMCKCRDDFVDESPDPRNRPGRICRPALVDECRLGKHDCHPNAICQDLAQGYTCHCKAEFIDQSPNRASLPGRVCAPRPTPPPEECRVDSLTSCKQELNEVCRLINGVPKCACPINYSRDPASNSCTVINECEFPQLNDCHPSAECIDKPVSYTCRCRDGFKDLSLSDKPGRNCQPLVNECQFPHLNDCHQNAECIDKEDGYECKCHQGFMDMKPQRPGRLCKQMIDECAKPNLNSCDKNAKCIDEEDGYRCECKPNFLDVSPSPTFRGRACRPIINECADPKLNDCDKTAKCTDTTDSYQCECPPNSKDISPNPAFPGRVCLIFENECLTGKHDCDPNAICRDNEQSFTCECARGYADRSPNKLNRPGRVCVELVDECATGRHTCSAQAECRDLEEGYTCECKDGFIDRSPNLLSQPGRVCGTPEVCPSNHECSSAAVCEPLGGNKYECTCIQGYIDQSPEGKRGRICVRNNACRDPRLNNCSRNAICYDEPKGYRCECARGYVDRSEDPSQRGRVCEPPTPPTPPPRHPCQDPLLNDCHPAGTCRATGARTYTCECLQGYVDRSPDLRNKPGRVCVLTEPICLDSSQNDCHPAAICSETDTDEKYTCRCRDGYIDQSPDKVSRPGRICVELVNECLDRSLNDCDPAAVCQDLPDGYTCRCPVNTEDRSPDPKRPGRRCYQHVNECRNPSLNNCSRFADCLDRPDGYECRCREGYHDDNPTHPGTVCNYIINECESSNLNDCDRHAECIDLAGGYECRCKQPYKDESPPGQPGRICRLNECLNPDLNHCDKNAICEDLDDGYICRCALGFYDNSPNPLEPGRVCVEFQKEHPVRVIPQEQPRVDGIPCGRNNVCVIARNEVCVSGVECACRPGEARPSKNDKCQPVDKTSLALRVITRDSEPLIYSSEYGNSDSVPYVEVTDLFSKDLGRSIGGTVYGPRYVTTEVNYITHPKTINSSWPDGLLFNFSVDTTQSQPPVDACDLWNQLMLSLQRSNGAIGGGSLRVASDVEQLNPCRKLAPQGDFCGQTQCNSELGEVCIAGSVCGCAHGDKRASANDVCHAVESWNVPLWVIRRGNQNIVYNETFANPVDALNKEYVRLFESGVGQCYPHTELKGSFVSAEVNEILDPMNINASWDTGVLFNCTMHFRKGSVRVPSDAYYTLVRYIIDRNNYQVGESGLYLNSYQPDPFKACFKNNCHPKGVCVDLGPNAYRCECGPGYRDLNPSDPGRRCLPNVGYNECERKEDNECSENARCIDQEHLYKCECLPSFTDASPPGAIPASVCVLDYCSDVNFCPANTTCMNLEQQAECQCNKGYVDIRKSEKRTQLLPQTDTLCLKLRDVDECALGLTNCSGVAECIDKAVGYECRCPEGYIDGNPEEPGRVCGALLCDLCNQHGDCVHNALTNNITCVCSDGWSGEFCNVAPSNASLILLIILAVLFLLLTLCCLLYFCTKCVCFKGRGLWYREPFTYRKGAWPWSTLEASTSSDSGADFSAMSAAGHEYYPEIGIPRAKLKSGMGAVEHDQHQTALEVSRLQNYLEDGVRIPRAHLDRGEDAYDATSESSSEYTIREEVERRVITDVTKTETRKTVTTADVHGTTAEFHVYPPIEVTTESHSSSQMAMRGGRNAEEQERGESVAEFSIGNAHREWSETNAHGRRVSEYSTTDRDLESVASASTADDEIYDRKTLVKRSHGYEPDPHGGTERYRTEVTTTTTMKGTNNY
ncbi:Transmembrane cell adhesion receptor mua-3 [Toxocara canis]|uniref:Transmembrane cell adhesion receptor mua-3 n=1 Tax=Toxocara canis TaxID=6265 RepID=A0A0B2V414_TOXCA|nr:Transmembrane cell adhesion receptor mua-3 [Toxocara canis]